MRPFLTMVSNPMVVPMISQIQSATLAKEDSGGITSYPLYLYS